MKITREEEVTFEDSVRRCPISIILQLEDGLPKGIWINGTGRSDYLKGSMAEAKVIHRLLGEALDWASETHQRD